jgi:tetratricopeptide (TPR) repeat protein
MLDATDEDLAARLLDLLRKDERWTEMVPIYKRLIDERPASSRQYLLELSQCLFRLGSEDEALAVLDQYRTDYADYEDTYLKLSAILSNHGHTQKAADTLREALERKDLEKSYRLHWQLGIVYVDLGETEKAIDSYEAALDLVGPGSDRDAINNRLIELYKQAERIDEVIEKREQEIEDIDAKLVKLYWAEAEKREKSEEFAAAIEYYGKIVALAPDSDTGKAAAARIEKLKPKLEE